MDFYLPPEGCSYRMAVVTIRSVTLATPSGRCWEWSFLRQFMYTKFVIVCDDDINARDWKDVIWAITTRMDPARDTTPDRAHPHRLPGLRLSGLRARPKMGLDATNKWPGRPIGEWGSAHRPGRGGKSRRSMPSG